MTYDEHDDATCTLRLRVYEPDPQPNNVSGGCVLERREGTRWLSLGRFVELEAAMKRAKNHSNLTWTRGNRTREHYRLTCVDTGQHFSYFDAIGGDLFPGLAAMSDAITARKARPKKADSDWEDW